jgi:5-methylcytosine-specific restriction endonuclease McrA
MSRTLRSERRRLALWRAQGGTCQRCGVAVPWREWEADHIVAWSKTLRTNFHELQVTCRRCNRQKGNRP